MPRGSTADNIILGRFRVCVLLWSPTSLSPKRTFPSFVVTMPHTLLVSFSLLALVVTARPIVPVSYVLNYDLSSLHSYFSFPSEYSQPIEVQNAVKAIFEERTKSVVLLSCTLPTFSSYNLGNPTSTFSALRMMKSMFV